MITKLNEGEYFGDAVKSRKIDGIILTEKVHLPGENLPNHSHKNAYFCTVIKGNWIEYFDNRKRECIETTTMFHPPEEIHSDIFEQKGYTFNIEFENEKFDYYQEICSKLTKPDEFYSSELNWLCYRIMYDFKLNDSKSSLLIQEMILELLSLISKKKFYVDENSKPGWLIFVEEIINEQFDSNINMEELAREVNTHPVHLSRTFKKFNNCRMGDYQRKLRILDACKKLTNSELPLSEIALECGFYDQAHFNRIFKKLIGLSPLQYQTCTKC